MRTILQGPAQFQTLLANGYFNPWKTLILSPAMMKNLFATTIRQEQFIRRFSLRYSRLSSTATLSIDALSSDQ